MVRHLVERPQSPRRISIITCAVLARWALLWSTWLIISVLPPRTFCMMFWVEERKKK